MTQKNDDMPGLTRYELFPSLVWTIRPCGFADHDQAMLDHVLALYQRDPGLRRSNVLGWHSPDQLHREAPFQPLARLIETLIHTTVAHDLALDLATERYRIKTMWAMVNPPYAYNHLHRHPGFLFSGVYHLQVPEGAGALNFHDPRADIRMLRPCFAADTRFTNYVVRFVPEPGRLMVFPSWLPHNVDPTLPNSGEAPRIAVSFDIAGEPVVLP